MAQLSDIEMLKCKLLNEYKKRGNLTHPKIIEISRALDEKIYLYLQNKHQSINHQ